MGGEEQGGVAGEASAHVLHWRRAMREVPSNAI